MNIFCKDAHENQNFESFFFKYANLLSCRSSTTVTNFSSIYHFLTGKWDVFLQNSDNLGDNLLHALFVTSGPCIDHQMTS